MKNFTATILGYLRYESSVLKYDYDLSILASGFCKIILFQTHNLFDLRFNYFNKTIKDCFSFFFKGLTWEFLLKTPIMNNKYLTTQLLENNNPISTKSATQILSLNHAQNLLLLELFITGLCGFRASFSFGMSLILFSW